MTIVTCPQCSGEDLELVRALEPSGRIIRCLSCGHKWQRGAERDASSSARAPKEDPTIVFDSDDAGYLEWARKNSFGYVINTTRPPSASYLVLHEAGCYHITVEDHRMHGQPWTGNDQMKVCSRSKHSLREWAQKTLGGELERCQTCAP